MHYEISPFDGYFHIFAAANLAYAISPGFRGIIQSGILTITQLNDSIVEKVISKYRSALAGPIAASANEKLKTKVEHQITAIGNKFKARIAEYERLRLANRKILEFKSLYLFTGIFSLVMLLLSGFQQFVFDEVKVWNLVFCFDIISVIFILWVTVLSFAFKREKLISHTAAAIFCLILFPLSFIYSFHCPIANSFTGNKITQASSMIIASLVPTAPFLMQVIKESLLLLTATLTSFTIEMQINRELNKIKEHVDFLQ